MASPSTSDAVPSGKCAHCGGQLYAGLTHGCTTAAGTVRVMIETPPVRYAYTPFYSYGQGQG